MVCTTFAQLRRFIVNKFEINSDYSMTIEELIEQSKGILNTANLNPELLRRLEILLSDENMVCFNTEAVVFGILAGRKDGQNTEQPAERLIAQLPFNSHITDFLMAYHFADGFDYEMRKETKHPHIKASIDLTNQVRQELNMEPIEFTFGKNCKCSMYFMESQKFLKALYVSQNTIAFAEYGSMFQSIITLYRKVHEKYLEISKNNQKKVITEQQETIADAMHEMRAFQKEVLQGQKRMANQFETAQAHASQQRATLIDTVNQTFNLVREVARNAAIPPTDLSKHTYVGIMLSVEHDIRGNLFHLYITRSQHKRIEKSMRDRLGGGASTVLVNPIYTINPIATVNKFREGFRNSVIEFVDQTHGLTNDDTIVDTIMNAVNIRGANNMFIRENEHTTIAGIVKMLLNEMKMSQRDSYNGTQPLWPKLTTMNKRTHRQFMERVREIITTALTDDNNEVDEEAIEVATAAALNSINIANAELDVFIHTPVEQQSASDSDDE